ncbi:MAG: prohibitin family protein [Candidatus Bathyarchaeota archaeon]|nr:prohibitin family protein [Candidatus Bathyarchaeota archaeon]
MDLDISIGLIIGVVIVFVFIYFRFGNELRGRARLRLERKKQFGDEYDRFQDTHNNPFIPDFIEKNPGRGVVYIIIALFLLITVVDCIHSVPPGHRGVVVTFGKVKEVNLGEGLQLKLPFIQEIVDMKVMLEKEEVHESAASSDLQEITTTLTVHFNIMPSHAWEVYQTMRQDYHGLLLRPVIQEDLKATTAKFTAEQLVTTRAALVLELTEKLRKSLAPYGIYIQTVNFVDFQFSAAFSSAIEAKVTAEQDALQAKNVLVRIEYEAQQKVIQAEADRNATIIAAEGDARRVEIAALAEAFRVTTEANATAEAILMITSQMTPEYAQYLHLMQWDGKYPSTMLGSLEDLGVIIDTTP